MVDGISFYPLDDLRQSGLNIRAPKGRRLDDEMIEYYSAFVSELGGKVLAYYLDGLAKYQNADLGKGVADHQISSLSELLRIV